MPNPVDLLTMPPAGLYCPAGDFYIDPWQPVARAVITHAHSDHARPGSQRYLAAADGRWVLQHRLGRHTIIDTLHYGERIRIADVELSLHPAGHVLGSAQVRIEHHGQVWVVSGDYKLAGDPTCVRFELVPCHVFVTESTFGLPIYRWPETSGVIHQLQAWWEANRAEGLVSILYAYALGKAQRILASLEDSSLAIYCHGAVESINACYRASGVRLPPTQPVAPAQGKKAWRSALIVAPPSAAGSAWLRKFGDISTAFASGWMAVRGQRRRRAIDRGLVISDHADWTGLCETIHGTNAERVLVTHGTTAAMVRWLRERGLQADELATRFEGEALETTETLKTTETMTDAGDEPA